MSNDPPEKERSPKLRRIQRNPMLSDLLNIYSSVGHAKKVNIKDPTALDNFLAEVRAALQESVDNDVMLYGHRTQAMFEAVAVSLGKIRLIRLEDASGGWFSGDALQVPDYRLITTDNKQILIEVKNCHSGLMGELALKPGYVAAVRAYGKLMRLPVMLAVYWSQLGIWTLNRIEDMERDGDHVVLSQERAMMTNEMRLLGDYMVGTRYPIRAEFCADEGKERSYNTETSVVGITIGRVRFTCAGAEITDRREQRLALAFMLYGNWTEDQQVSFDEGGKPIAISYEFAPGENDPDQWFGIIGAISEMSSKMFRMRTQKGSEVTQVSADLAPEFWESLMPRDVHGEALPLWRFVIQPNRRAEKRSKSRRKKKKR